ncbi:MAG: helix-turn-helix domain-containing protein [Alphaproteobacteria bacterium]|nr:helix-turn-helix domain-containing protein [Alphaproteobacteria bacterium]
MQFQFVDFQPPELLRPFLKLSFYACGQIPYRYDRILPNGLAVAIFNIGNPHRLGSLEDVDSNPLFDHSWFHGVQTRPLYNLPTERTRVLGLLFEPIGVHALFGTDMRRLADATVDTRDVLPAKLVQRIEAMLPKAGEEATHLALHQALLDYRGRSLPPWLQPFYETVLSVDNAMPLSQAYGETGRSARYAGDRFKRATGVSPKVLGRIHRLNALLAAIDPEHPIRWTELAHRFGFFDQAHFNREFKRFAGLSPSRYQAERLREFPALQKGEHVSFVPRN